MVEASPEGVTLGLHILAGFLALFAGAGALATEKGGRRHRRLGRAFVFAMTFVAASTLVLYAFEQTTLRLFLVFIAVFSYYFVFSGFRVLSRKRPADEPALVDWVAVALLGLSGVALLAIGGWLTRDGSPFAPVVLVFGAIAALVAVADVRQFRSGESEPRAWLFDHLQRMCAGYIAAVSAFSAVNFSFLPTAVRWLWPTALGVPVIFYYVRSYRSDSGPSPA